MTPHIYSMTGLELAIFGLSCMAAGSLAMIVAIMLATTIRSGRGRRE